MVTEEVKDLKDKLVSQKKELKEHKKELVSQKKELKEHDETVRELNQHKAKVVELKAEKKRLQYNLRKHADLYFFEMRRSLSTAILAAFAFLMALSWREYIDSLIDSLFSIDTAQGDLISALAVTFFSVIGIILVTKFLQVEDKKFGAL